MMGALTLAVLIALSIYRHRQLESSSLQTQTQTQTQTRKATKSATSYSVGLGGSRGGIYWSGAMRCPKCRSDMDKVQLDGVEIDRCSSCHGLWFDAGEMEKLKDRKTAAAIDIGDPEKGKAHNDIDRYRCPRCGGNMVRMSDPQQRHIWFEKCGSCHGSYFDAGEFNDLATVTVSDFFKRFTTPERT